MKLDTRAIVITITVIILGVAAWLLVQPVLNEDTSAATTSRGLGSTTSATVTTPTTPDTTTTAAPTSTNETTTTSAATTSTSQAPTTTASTSTTVEAPPTTRLDFEPDVSLCEANDLAPTKCRWVDRVHPPINSDPREEPAEYLRQFVAFVDWSLANPAMGRDLGFIAFGADLLAEITQDRTEQINAGRISLGRNSIEDAELVDSSGSRVELQAVIVDGESHVLVDGSVVETHEPSNAGTWRFVAEHDPDVGWRLVVLESVE